MDTMIMQIPLLLLILGLCYIAKIIITETIDSKTLIEKDNKPINSYTEIKNILDKTIEQELFYYVKLDLGFKSVKIVDFDKSLSLISTRIVNSFAQTFIDEFTYYHTEEWMMEYVVKNVRSYLTDYIRNNPI